MTTFTLHTMVTTTSSSRPCHSLIFLSRLQFADCVFVLIRLIFRSTVIIAKKIKTNPPTVYISDTLYIVVYSTRVYEYTSMYPYIIYKLITRFVHYRQKYFTQLTLN